MNQNQDNRRRENFSASSQEVSIFGKTYTKSYVMGVLCVVLIVAFAIWLYRSNQNVVIDMHHGVSLSSTSSMNEVAVGMQNGGFMTVATPQYLKNFYK
jgi:hypothetical protein